MNPKLARFLVRFYSPEWRSRYGDEFAAFLEEGPLSANVLFDVAKMGLLESLSQRLRRRAQAFRGVVLFRAARLTSGTLALGAIVAFAVIAEATPLLAMHRGAENFLTCSSDPRIKYQPGAVEISAAVAALLPRAIEDTQCHVFLNSSYGIYICASEKALQNLSGQQERGGSRSREFIYISPQNANDPDRIFTTLEDHLRHLKNGRDR